jgi:hypothetical protein
MGGIEDESIRLFSPAFANKFVLRKVIERLQSSAEIVGGDEVSEMLPKLIVALIVEALAWRELP